MKNLKTRSKFVVSLICLSGGILGAIFSIVIDHILTITGPQPGGFVHIVLRPEDHGFAISSHPIFRVIRSVVMQLWPIFLGMTLASAFPFKNKLKNRVVLTFNVAFGIAAVLCVGVLGIFHLFGVYVGRIGEGFATLFVGLIAIGSIWENRNYFES
ncbi:MAG: hypothetical protein KGZ89_02950 [Actinobacteria bacterium]|nr:hypothetical protein [Actinomycetota bacterium]